MLDPAAAAGAADAQRMASDGMLARPKHVQHAQ